MNTPASLTKVSIRIGDGEQRHVAGALGVGAWLACLGWERRPVPDLAGIDPRPEPPTAQLFVRVAVRQPGARVVQAEFTHVAGDGLGGTEHHWADFVAAPHQRSTTPRR
jgi:hypothetical protein